MENSGFKRLAISGAITLVATIGALRVTAALPRTALVLSALIGAGVVWAEWNGKERGKTVGGFLSAGLAVLGFYVGLTATSVPPARSDGSEPIARLGLKTGDIAQVRIEPDEARFQDPVRAEDGQAVRYRLTISNLDDVPVRDLWVRLAVRQQTGYGVIEASFSSISPIRQWPTDIATVEYADDRTQGALALDADFARLVESNGTEIRKLPRGIDESGVNLGDIDGKSTVCVEVVARMPARRQQAASLGAAQIEQGDFVYGTNLSRSGSELTDPVVVGVGDRLLVRTRVHIASQVFGSVTAHASVPDKPAPFSRVKVTLRGEQTFPRASSDVLLVNFEHGQHLRLQPIYGTARRADLYGHTKNCRPRSEPYSIDDGIFEGGIPVMPVGYQDLDDECSEVTPFIEFVVKAVR